MANNVDIGCRYYLYYQKRNLEIDETVTKYFRRAQEFLEVLKKMSVSRVKRYLVWGGGSSDLDIENIEKKITKYEKVIEKIYQGKATEGEVEELMEFADYVATYNLLKSHAEWLEELERHAFIQYNYKSDKKSAIN